VCRRNDKAVVITRCFHCFCDPCIRTRLDTRQRKCPSCAETFGANDVQRIYLTM
jgi:E3 ubiquitin-protein ligase BRE1